ncbi:hypothetical protein F4677DRAFT_410311 [Hypoxylon crocopeplum]|nr:hypothetical protein F4677DRAFT_410311 [Hypoxylon crocopeplum]
MEWINLSNGYHGTQETRTRVRSHAMRATAASRRKTGTWGKRNLRQLPENPILDEVTRGHSISTDDKACTGTGSTVYQPNTDSASSKSLWRFPRPTNMPLSGLELLAAEIGIHILDISALTEIQCGWTACAIFTSQRSSIKGLISRRQSSYLYCAASRYGHNTYLDEALRCVAIRAKRIIAPSSQSFDKSESLHYVAALNSLQKAINDDGERQRPDVLCAINLLSLFELLQFTRQEAWALHTVGASRLIRTRGPTSFVSDFDIRLMLSLTTPITHEYLRNNEACYFEEHPWQQMFQSFIIPDDLFSYRSQLAISLTCIMVKGPRLVRDVCDVVNKSDVGKNPDLTQLMKRLREYRKELLRWHAEYETVMLTTPSRGAQAPSEDVRGELLVTYYGLFIISSRLMSAISTDLIEVLEDEAVAHATLMVGLENDVSLVDEWAYFYVCQKIIIAGATLATTTIWRENLDQCSDIIEEYKFRAWWLPIIGKQPFP